MTTPVSGRSDPRLSGLNDPKKKKKRLLCVYLRWKKRTVFPYFRLESRIVSTTNLQMTMSLRLLECPFYFLRFLKAKMNITGQGFI